MKPHGANAHFMLSYSINFRGCKFRANFITFNKSYAYSLTLREKIKFGEL